MHTLIRDQETTKHDFVFYADRLIRLVRGLCFPAPISVLNAVCVFVLCSFFLWLMWCVLFFSPLHLRPLLRICPYTQNKNFDAITEACISKSLFPRCQLIASSFRRFWSISLQCVWNHCVQSFTHPGDSVLGICTVGGGAWVRASAIYREAGYHTHRCAVPLSHFHSGSGDFFEILI
jgi:hypothetical protein